MNTYKEIKEIAKCASKIQRLVEKLEEKIDIDIDDMDWERTELVSLTKEQIRHFEKTNGVTSDYFVEQHQSGDIEDSWYGWLWFKTDVNGQYVKVPFECF